MSTQRSEPTEGPPADRVGDTGGSRFVLTMRVLAGASALVSLLALWSVEARQLTHDLQLAAESSAAPGQRMALRALIFRDVEAPEGATLASAPTRVSLRDRAGRELTSVALEPSALTTLDGTLRLPGSLAGEFTLEARATFEGRELTCVRSLRVDARAPAVRAHGREAGPLQHLSLGTLHQHAAAPAVGSAAAPQSDANVAGSLVPRVVGGACIPGEPCRVLVWMGEPAAALRARVDSGAEIVAEPEPAGETTGIVELRTIVRGPDAQLTLEARRGGKLVAERAVRLPVGLGEVGLTTAQSLLVGDALRVSFVPPPGREYLTFDSFVDQHWSGIRVVAAQQGVYVVAPEWVGTGIFRVQARADRLSADGAGARVFYVRAPAEQDGQALQALAKAAAAEPLLANEPTREWAEHMPAFALEAPQQTAAFLLAGLEQLRMPVPLPVSGRPAQLARLEHTRALFRFGVAGALVLSAFVIALSVARRGILAADEAQSILDLARAEGDNEVIEPRRGELLGARVRVLLLAFAVAVAFLAAALLIAAKPLWF